MALQSSQRTLAARLAALAACPRPALPHPCQLASLPACREIPASPRAALHRAARHAAAPHPGLPTTQLARLPVCACVQALAIDCSFTKARYRRALAYYHQGNLEMAVMDMEVWGCLRLPS